MRLNAAKRRETWVWGIAVIAALFLGLVFFLPYVFVITLAILVAYLTNPIYRRIDKKLNKPGLSAALTAISAFFIIIIPLFIVGGLAVVQLRDIVSEIRSESFEFNKESLQQISYEITNTINRFLEPIVGNPEVIKEGRVEEFITNQIPSLLNSGVNVVVDFSKSLPSLLTSSIIFLFLYVGYLTGQKKLLENIRILSPFREKETDLYLNRIGAMTNAMFTGQLLISFCQSLVGALSLALVGFGEYFILLTLVFTFLNMIPLGSGIITIPVGAIIALTGNVIGGLMVILTHIFVVSNIDNFMRPKLIPKDVQFSPGLTLLSVFAGVYYFGLLGVIYGPVVAIVISTTIETYIQLKKDKKVY